MTTSFTSLMDTIRQSTTPAFYLAFCHKLALLAAEDAPTTGATITQAMRDVGTPDGKHKPIGTPTRPMTLTWGADPLNPKHREAY